MLKKIIKNTLIVSAVAAVILGLMMVAFFAARFISSSGGNRVSAIGQESTPPVSREMDERVNFLVLGRDDASGLCDMMMLASYNITEGSMNVVQIPRDTYAEFTSGSYKKINGAVAALGSERALCDFLSDALCVPIDHYVSFDLKALCKLVDVLGGVEVDVPFDMDYDDPAQGLSIHIKAGKQLLDGKRAEQFVRYRSGYLEGDVGRMDAQKLFLSSLFKKIRSDASILTIASLAATLADDIDTDASISNIVTLARKALVLSAEKIRFVTLAGEGAVAEKSGASYYVISRDSAIEITGKYLGGTGDEKSFDKDRKFLNENYDSFSKIYYSKADYTVYDAATLASGGIEIERKN